MLRVGEEQKVVLVTGSNTGVGYETARRLALGGYEVVLGCRDRQKASTAAHQINAEVAARGDAGGVGLAIPMHLDLADLDSVRHFVSVFEATGKKLHVVVGNAGLNSNTPPTTKQGQSCTV
jgi:NAD(P)-dependent dehydrogenase (short-subunit alcohol dehydrogenase family)